MREDERAPSALTLLAEGSVEIKGRMPWSSNGTFLCELSDGDAAMAAVYKPGRGERPLWDFPPRLYRREVAAYELSALLGWELVPETVRRDGPLGEGSMQRFVDADFDHHYFTLADRPELEAAFRALAVFDIVANNTDRKSGHVLLGHDGRIRGIDNALCFHAEPKLRTVIWEFGGEAIDDGLLADVERAVAQLPGPLDGLLDTEELDALCRRGRRLLDRPTYPLADPSDRCYPWPLV